MTTPVIYLLNCNEPNSSIQTHGPLSSVLDRHSVEHDLIPDQVELVIHTSSDWESDTPAVKMAH